MVRLKPALCAFTILLLAGCSNGSDVASKRAQLGASRLRNAPTGGGDRSGATAPTFTKIVSLAPSDTELLYSIGAQDKLIGVCTQCDYPPNVSAKPRVGSFTTVDLEKMTMIQPDVVLLVNGQEALDGNLNAHKFRTLMLQNKRVLDVADNADTLGQATGTQAQAEKVSRAFRSHVQHIQEIAQRGKHPRVFFCAWPTPIITVGSGSYLNDAVTTCGGNNVSGKLQAAYPQYNAEKLVVEQPDVIILPHEADYAEFLKKPPWTALKAVREHRTYFLPPREKDFLSRPTFRLEHGLIWLAKRLNPELASQFEHEESSWQQ